MPNDANNKTVSDKQKPLERPRADTPTAADIQRAATEPDPAELPEPPKTDKSIGNKH